MALTTWTLSGNVKDILGDAFTVSPGKPHVSVTLLCSEELLSDTVSGARVGSAQAATIGTDGSLSFPGLPDSSSGHPLYRLRVKARSEGGEKPVDVTTGWFEMTADRTVSWVVENAVAVAVVTAAVVAQIDAAVALGATNDTATASFIETEGSATDVALKATIAGEITAATQGVELSTWQTALAAAKAGTADAKVLCVGDSTTIGVDPTAGAPQSYPYQLAALLDAETDIVAAHGLAVPTRAIQADTRWTVGASWVEEAYGWGGSSAHKGPVGCGPLSFTDANVVADRYDIYYLRANGAGTITVDATGGATTTQDSHDTTPSIGVFTVSAGSASAANVVTITNASAGDIHIVGIEPWHSTTKRVRVGNAGLAGATADAWALPKSGLGAPACIEAYAPDLTIISLGVNDAFYATSGADFMADLEVIIAAARVSGDVLLFSPVPSSSGVEANRLTYEPIYDAEMAASGYAYLDLYARWGEPGSDDSAAFMNDGLHPNAAGNADLAAFLLPSLLLETSPLATRAVVNEAVAGRAATADVQTFTTSGTWTKPAGATSVQVLLVGPGGGGGAGARGASGVALTGGAGGGGGGVVFATLPADLLGAAVSVTVLAGGAGGSAQTTDSTAGANGSTPAGHTVFGTLTASRGNGGAGGTISGSSAVAGTGGSGILAGGSGGAASAGNNGNAAAAPTGGPGGGGGGGVSTVPAAKAGGNGGASTIHAGSGGTGGVADAAGTAGSAVTVVSNGGGGGGSSITATGKAGGAAGYGAGGGGGGASLNGSASGAGGAGGGGLCIVTTYF